MKLTNEIIEKDYNSEDEKREVTVCSILCKLASYFIDFN